MREYVVGLVTDGSYMAFIRKNRPQWQRGLLNGIGGKVEENESHKQAMVREFREETGLTIEASRWRLLANMEYPAQAHIVFYTAKVSHDELSSLKSETDERVEVHSVEYPHMYPQRFIHNLHWLIPLALHYERYAAVNVIGLVDPVEGDIVQC